MNETKGSRWFLLASAYGLFLLLFLFSRLPYLLYQPVANLNPDSFTYFMAVDQMEKGLWPDFAIRTPGFPVFWFLLRLLWKRNLAVILAQNLLTLFSGLLFIHAVWRIRRDSRLALLASMGLTAFVCSTTHLLADISLMTESLFVSTLVFFFALLLLALFQDRKLFWSLAGFSAAWAILIRPAGMFLLVLVLLLIFFLWRRHSRLALLFLLAPFVLLLLGASLYNRLRVGSWALSNFTEHALVSYASTFLEEDSRFPAVANQAVLACRERLAPGDRRALEASWNPLRLNGILHRYYNSNRIVVFNTLLAAEPADSCNLYLKWRPLLRRMATKAISRHPLYYGKFLYSSLFVYFFAHKKAPDFLVELTKVYRHALAFARNFQEIDPGGSVLRLYQSQSYVRTIGAELATSFLGETASPQQVPYAVRRDNGRWVVQPRSHALQRLQQSLFRIRALLFGNAFWVIAALAVFVLALVRLCQTGFRDQAAFFVFLLLLAAWLHGLVVSLTSIPLLRYTYVLEFAYFESLCLLPLLLRLDDHYPISSK